MRTVDLKPCPFCGGEAKIEKRYDTKTGEVNTISIHCNKCSAGFTKIKCWWIKEDLEAKSVKLWNLRVGEEEKNG